MCIQSYKLTQLRSLQINSLVNSKGWCFQQDSPKNFGNTSYFQIQVYKHIQPLAIKSGACAL